MVDCPTENTPGGGRALTQAIAEERILVLNRRDQHLENEAIMEVEGRHVSG